MRVGLRTQVIQFGFLFFDAQLLCGLPEFYIVVNVPHNAEKENRTRTVSHLVFKGTIYRRKNFERRINVQLYAQQPPGVSPIGIEQNVNPQKKKTEQDV